jgi:N6-adenosine-specific RNA methylase IME4
MLAKMKEEGEISKSPKTCRGVTTSKETLSDLGISRDISSRAQRIAAVPEADFESVIAEAKEGERELTRRAVEKLLSRADNNPIYREQTERGCTVNDLQKLVDDGRKFGVIYADPPWVYSNQGTRAATGNHYTGMTVDELCELPIRNLAADDSFLHLWTTNAFLFDCQRIMSAWGFEYKSLFVWVKPQMGIGNYWRVSHEILLLGKRGNAKWINRALKSWGQFERTKHSAKPEQIRTMIESACDGPYLELFGRRPANGWVVWGNQIEQSLFHQQVA